MRGKEQAVHTLITKILIERSAVCGPHEYFIDGIKDQNVSREYNLQSLLKLVDFYEEFCPA